MIKRSFLKNYFIHSLKYLFDFSYFITISFLACITSGIEVFYNHFTWKNNLLSYQLSSLQNLNLLNSCLIFIISFISTLFIAIIARFFANMLFFNSKKSLQRGAATFFTFVYTIICFYTIYKFGYSNFYINLDGKTINFILIVFFVYSTFYYIIKNKLFNMNKNKKIFILIIVALLIVLIDWAIVHYSRNKIQDKIFNNSYIFIFYNNKNILSSVTTWPQLQNTLNDKVKSGSHLFVNNLGDPNSFNFISKIDNYSGHVCKNDYDSLNKYNLFVNLLPLTNFIPNRIAIEFFPEIFCLNLGKNFSEVFLFGIYSNIMKSGIKNSYQVSFVNLAGYHVSSEEIIKQHEQLFSLYPYVREHTQFYFISGNP